MVKTILIVDDSFLDQQLISDLFKRSMCLNGWSLTIVLASCLTQAKDYLQKYQFDIVTIDGQMGLERGYDIIPLVKEFQIQYPDIIMISNHGKSINYALNNGVIYAIVKDDIKKNMRISQQFALIPMD